MLQSIRYPRIALFTTLAGVIAYIASLILLVASGVSLSTTVEEALIIASILPGLFGAAYTLQATAFLLWALLPVSAWQRYRIHAPGFALLAMIVGGFGFAWRALADFAKAGSMEFLGQVYRSTDPALKLFATQLAAWTQLWTFGALWELIGNGLAFGVFPLLVGLLLLAAQRVRLGWTTVLFGGLAAISWISAAVLYVLGLRDGLQIVGAPGYATLAIAPLWLGWLAWHCQRPPAPQHSSTPANAAAPAEPIPAT